MASRWKIGVISDTHGMLRTEALIALDGVDHIIHAGDIGSAEIITTLKQIAPVSAVRGNTDNALWAESLPLTNAVVFGDSHIYVLHDLNDLDLDPQVAGSRAVVTGHTHRQKAEMRNGVLFLNPGAAGRRRYADVPASLALVTMTETEIDAEIVELTDV